MSKRSLKTGWLRVLLPFWVMQASGEIREIRVASFNTMLFRGSGGELVDDLGTPSASEPRRVAEIIQRVDPDIILLNEFDYDEAHEALERFNTNFLGIGQGGQAPISFPYRYVAESNTGISSGFDLNNRGGTVTTVGAIGYGEDSFGFGQFPGQYGMAVYSKFPILEDQIRTFQRFLWKDMPGDLLPDLSLNPAAQDWYNAEELEIFRLSSKSHWDLPIDVDGEVIHLLAAHPTPPTFDGGEDRNGRRNHDEIRLWADYVLPGAGGYLYDDGGGSGGIGEDVRFVICGDYNADPVDGDSVNGAINQLLGNPAVNASITPEGASGTTDTSTFGLRVDYVLPSLAGFEPQAGAIFWPTNGQPGADLIGASDHRLVWMDLALTPLISEVVRGLEIRIDGQDVILSWGAADGIGYDVGRSPDLEAWGPATGSGVDVLNGQASYRDVGAATVGGRKYYRVSAAFLEE